MSRKAVIFNIRDNVATALSDLKSGDRVECNVEDRNTVTVLAENIPFGHKFSVGAIKSGAPVIKYGETIGIALKDINPGDYVHVHNVASARGRGDLV